MTQDIRIRGAIEPNLTFLTGESVEVMRIHKNGVTVNPAMALDEAAHHVINALDAHIKRLIEAEREACAEKTGEFARKWWSIHCESNKHMETTLKAHQDFCALQAAIRSRKTT
jgi:transaldolase